MKKSFKRKQPQRPKTYTVLDELMASPTKPMPLEFRTHQLTRMYEGLHASVCQQHLGALPQGPGPRKGGGRGVP